MEELSLMAQMLGIEEEVIVRGISRPVWIHGRGARRTEHRR
jgi:hypothetical protein